MNSKTCIIIVGPTAVGKTAFAIEVAKKFNTRVISADSRQCFRELNIGVAKPSLPQLQQVYHYFIDTHSVQQEVHAALFEAYALVAVNEIFQSHDVAVMVGGTGLYINAFCNGMDDVPLILPEVRAAIITAFKEYGLEWLQQQVKINDPAYSIDGEMLNPQRLMRTLEVKLSTGRSIRSFQTGQKKKRPFNIVKIGLELPRQTLHQNINHRVDDMMLRGLEDEVRQLLPFRHLNALNTVGYKEFFAYLDGQISLSEAMELVKKNTRLYAKRQLTWFKKDESVTWTHPENYEFIMKFLE